MQRTGERGLEFGVKITNTFPVDGPPASCPARRCTCPAAPSSPSLSLAARLAREFKGKLRISYSGGADIHSVRAPLDTGIWPITMATTVLKPGGYQRFSQIGRALADISYEPWEGWTRGAACLAEGIPCRRPLSKPMKPIPSRKLDKKVPPSTASPPLPLRLPHRAGHPRLSDEGRRGQVRGGAAHHHPAQRPALHHRHHLPHRCQDKCMRNAYDESVYIRARS